VEGLRSFFAVMQAACAQNESDSNFKGCLALWRQDAHRLYLDDRLHVAIAAYPGTDTTKEKWKTDALRLAGYAWHRQMSQADYTRWLRTLDLQGLEFKAACEWTGLTEKQLRALISQFQSHRAGSSAGSA